MESLEQCRHQAAVESAADETEDARAGGSLQDTSMATLNRFCYRNILLASEVRVCHALRELD